MVLIGEKKDRSNDKKRKIDVIGRKGQNKMKEKKYGFPETEEEG